MDNLDRMYRHLVRTIRGKFPQYLTQPFDVASLQQTILPYRLHRRELGLETNEDYEITLTELLAGERDYLIVDERMRDALKAELKAVNPDPTAFKQFAPAMVALSPNALRSLDAGPDDPTTPLRPVAVPDPAASDVRSTTPPPPEPPPAPPASRPSSSGIRPSKKVEVPAEEPRAPTLTTAPSGARAITPETGERCRACNEVLPTGRPITFCPHCGQNVTMMNCPACGSELEVGWKFCPVCGRPADAH
jgi:double zinc ribbon protein